VPRVSILIPSYNHAPFLKIGLEGVLAQTFEDWEVVLVDDGSTDQSLEVARSFGDSRIRAFQNEKNLGTYGTQQRALELAEGSLIAVLNSDDLWAPTKLEKQVAALDHNPDCGFCYVLGWKIDDDGKVDESEDVHLDWPTSPKHELLPYLLTENRVLASGVLFRREGLAFNSSCRYCGDWVVLLERAFHGQAACVPERLTYWRMHGTNASKVSEKLVLEEIRVRKSILKNPSRWMLPRLDSMDVRRGLAVCAMNLLVLHMFFLDKSGARNVALQALKFHPNKKSCIKRAVSTLLPSRYVQRHFCTGNELDWEAVDHVAGQRAIREQAELEFRL
jgi:glycosyltransferase involved in cell wall biosynthesis